MDFRTTSIKHRQAGLSLIETMVATGITSLLFLVFASFSLYSARNCASLSNYADLESQSRLALDQMTRQIRQTRGLISNSQTNLVFRDADGGSLEYLYDPQEKTLNRLKNGVKVRLLDGCDYIKFSIFQRNPIAGSYDAYPTGTPATCKLVQLTWVCSRKLLGARLNTQSVQSAKIVIRKRA